MSKVDAQEDAQRLSSRNVMACSMGRMRTKHAMQANSLWYPSCPKAISFGRNGGHAEQMQSASTATEGTSARALVIKENCFCCDGLQKGGIQRTAQPHKSQ